jgi:hypothetical protein
VIVSALFTFKNSEISLRAVRSIHLLLKIFSHKKMNPVEFEPPVEDARVVIGIGKTQIIS